MTEADKLSLAVAFALAFVTTGMAVATCFLAWFTFKLVKSGGLSSNGTENLHKRPTI
jgi:hypothetical protein